MFSPDPFSLALLGGSAISTLGGMWGSGKARRDMEQAAAQARAAQAQGYEQGRNALTAGRDSAMGYYNPLIQSGDTARAAYETSIGLRGREAQQGWNDDMIRDPGYQAGLDQGRRQIDASAFSRGMGMSGATLKALQRQGYNYLTDATQARRAAYSPLMQQGQGASDAAARMQYGYGGDMSRLYTGQGEDAANSYLAAGQMRAQSRMQPINALTQSLNSGMQAYGYGMGRQGPQQQAPQQSWGGVPSW